MIRQQFGGGVSGGRTPWVAFVRLILIFLFASCSSQLDYQESPLPSSAGSQDEDPSHELLLRIVTLDVGQGDSAVVITPDGDAILIDAGPPGSGSDVIIPFLRSEGIATLHSIFISHYDSDHAGGLQELIDDGWTPNESIWNRDNINSEVGVEWEIDGVKISALVVDGVFEDGLSVFLSGDDENARSVGLMIEYGAVRYLTAGDLTGGGDSGETATVDLETHLGELARDVDILKVSHHGSSTSTGERFLDLVTPEVAIISVGKENDFGHPNPEVLKRLTDRGTEIRRTTSGNIEIQSDGESYWVVE